MPFPISGLSIRARLLLTLGLSLVLVGASALLGLWQTRHLATTVESLYADRLIPLSLLRDMMRDLGPLGLGSITNPSNIAAPPLTERETQQVTDGLQRRWQAYLHTRLVTAEGALAERIQPQLDSLLQGVATADRAPPDKLRALNLQRLTLLRQLDELSSFQLSQARLETERSRDATGDAARFGVLLVLLTAALCGLLIWNIWARYDEERRAGEASQDRLRRLYRALSETNQLIVRRETTQDLAATAEQLLFDGLCRICVNTGHAKVALVTLADGACFERAATCGDVERWMPGAPPRWAADNPFAQGSASTRAILSGSHVVVNRPQEDPLTRNLPVIPPGIEAIAAFPLRRGGVVIGSLGLLAGETDFFDDAVVRLLDEMAADLSFALDNIARERDRAQALAAAREANDELRSLVGAMPVHMMLTRLPDGVVLEINEAMCRRYGITREEALGRRLIDLGVGMLPAYRQHYYELLQTQKEVIGTPTRAVARDGRILESRVYARRIRYQGQDCVIGCSVDQDDLKDLTNFPDPKDFPPPKDARTTTGVDEIPAESPHADPQS